MSCLFAICRRGGGWFGGWKPESFTRVTPIVSDVPVVTFDKEEAKECLEDLRLNTSDKWSPMVFVPADGDHYSCCQAHAVGLVSNEEDCVEEEEWDL